MFGLEDQKKKKKVEDFSFELETELKDPKKNKEIVDKVHSRIQLIKEQLQAGIDKSDFDVVGKILYGYSSLLKVISRSTGQK